MRNMSNSIYHELERPNSLEVLKEFDGDSLTVQYTAFDQNHILCFGKIPDFVRDASYLTEVDIDDLYVEMIRENFVYSNTAVDRMFWSKPITYTTACVEASIFYDEDLNVDERALVRTYVKGILLSLSKRMKERLRRLTVDTKKKEVPQDTVSNKLRKFFGMKQKVDVVEFMGLDYSRIYLYTMLKHAAHEILVKLGVENQKILDTLRVGMVFNAYYGQKAVERNSDIFTSLKIYRIG